MAQTQRVRHMGDSTSWPGDLTEDLIAAGVAAGYLQHHGRGTQVSTADASDLATSKTLAKALADAFLAHAEDLDLHEAEDTTMGTLAAAYASSPDEPADLTEVQNIANELKTDINAHIPHATAHRGRGAQSGGIAAFTLVTAANASDQDTANTLLNELKACFNRHVQLGMKNFGVD